MLSASRQSLLAHTGLLSLGAQIKEQPMKLTSLKELLIHQLRDLYSAEEQLVVALPKMAKAAKHPELREAFESHLVETKAQLERVAKLLEQVGSNPDKTKCAGMAGCVKEGSDVIEEDGDIAVKDAALIGAAQRAEHYEIAGYGTTRSLAQALGLTDVAEELEAILEEEKAADERLTEISENVNRAAAGGGSSEVKEVKPGKDGKEVGAGARAASSASKVSSKR